MTECIRFAKMQAANLFISSRGQTWRLYPRGRINEYKQNNHTREGIK